MTRETMSLMVWSAFMMSRSTSGTRPKGPRIWSTISRCWPVATTWTASPGSARRACTTGRSLIASGRVPRTIRINGRLSKRKAFMNATKAAERRRLHGARVLFERHDLEGRLKAFEHLVHEIDLGGGRQVHTRKER